MSLSILMIADRYPPSMGGIASHVYYLALALSKINRNLKIHILTHNDEGGRHTTEGNTPHFRITKVNFNSPGSTLYKNAVDVGLFLCRNYKFDIVHAHHLASTQIGLRMKYAYNIPIVASFYKTPLPMAQPDEFYYKRNAYYLEICYQKEFPIDKYIATSKNFLDELIKVHKFDPNKVEFIYHGVPYKFLQNKALKYPLPASDISLFKDREVIVCPSRLDPRKRLELFIRAAGELRKALPSKRFLFLITGTPPEKEGKDKDEQEKYLNELKGIAKDVYIENDLLFKSYDFDFVPALFNSAKICVLPSDREGLGLVLLEALALKTPVVAANAKGIDEVIKNGHNGLTFISETKNDFMDLANQMIKLLGDKNLANKLIRNGIDTIRQNFNAAVMAQHHLRLYREIIDKKEGLHAFAAKALL